MKIHLIGTEADNRRFSEDVSEDVSIRSDLPTGFDATAEIVDPDLDALILLAPRNDALFVDLVDRLLELAGTYAGPVGFAVPFASATELSDLVGGDRPVFALGYVPHLSNPRERIEYSLPIQSDAEAGESIAAIVSRLFDGEPERVADRVGHISARILSMIINEATFALLEGVANPADVDTAMRLGTAYPKGPLAWCDEIGADVIVDLLDGLQRDYGEERYRPSVLLRQHARAGVPFHPES